MARPQHYPSPSKAEFPDGIKLMDFPQRSAPPSYHSNASAAAGGKNSLQPPRPPASRQDTNTILASLSQEKLPLPHQQVPIHQKEPTAEPITPARILREHVLTRRKEQYFKYEDQGDVLVDRFVTLVKTLTVVGVVFMFIWTAYKWYSLGPEYAPVDPTGGGQSGSGS